jgi:hypothetical protein
MAGWARSPQIPDPDYDPVVENPTYDGIDAPVIAVDATHWNFHTLNHNFTSFGELLSADGYTLESFRQQFTLGCVMGLHNCPYWDALNEVDTLVIANAMQEISAEEAQLIAAWVRGDLCEVDCIPRNLLLIADHQRGPSILPGGYNFPLMIQNLAPLLGLDWPNSNVEDRTYTLEGPFYRNTGGILNSTHPIVLGRNEAERIPAVVTLYGSGFAPLPGFVGESLLSLPVRGRWWDSDWTPHVTEGFSQGMAFDYGTGRVYASGEAGMFTQQAITEHGASPPFIIFGWGMGEKLYNEQYLLNVMHWLDGVLN